MIEVKYSKEKDSVEVRYSEEESWFYNKFDDDHPLLIAHTLKRPGEPYEEPKIFGGLLEEGGLDYRESGQQVQISKHCVSKLKDFLNAKMGFVKIGKLNIVGMGMWIVEDCVDGDDVYHFKISTTEITQQPESITIYWIAQGSIGHVEIDLFAIPELMKFLNENF